MRHFVCLFAVNRDLYLMMVALQQLRQTLLQISIIFDQQYSRRQIGSPTSPDNYHQFNARTSARVMIEASLRKLKIIIAIEIHQLIVLLNRDSNSTI